MLGPPKPRRLDEPVTVSLEALVPPDNFYRHLEATLDLGFVRAWVRDRYTERGRPGTDPVIFFKLRYTRRSGVCGAVTLLTQGKPAAPW